MILAELRADSRGLHMGMSHKRAAGCWIDERLQKLPLPRAICDDHQVCQEQLTVLMLVGYWNRVINDVMRWRVTRRDDSPAMKSRSCSYQGQGFIDSTEFC